MGDHEKDPKEKKEKKEKKDKGDKEKEPKEKKEKKEKKDKGDKDPEKEKEKKEKKEKKAKAEAEARPRTPPKLLKPGLLPKKNDDYLADMDLPSSDDEQEVVREEREIDVDLSKMETDKDAKKKQKKEMIIAAKIAAEKEAAMRDEDDAFTVRLAKQVEEMDLSDHMSRDIKVEGFSVMAKGKELMKNTTFNVVHGRRYGLVGPNGKGKSTLLRLLARRQIPVPEYIDVLLVEQEVIGDDRTAIQAVVEADVELVELRKEEKQLTEWTAGDDEAPVDENGKLVDLDAAHARLIEVYDALRDKRSDAAEGKAAKMLNGLGFTPVMQGRQTKTFSGGWRMRISLARALFICPTLLLLDEPTNHLDLRAVIWLEEYLMRWKKTLIVVSHDREFLDSVCTDIIHLHDLKLQYYRGSFLEFNKMYEQRRVEANKAFDKYEKAIKAAKQSQSRNSSAKDNQEKLKQNQQRKQKGKKGKQADEDDDVDEEPTKWNDYDVKFHLPNPTELPPPLMQMIDVEFKYPGRDDFALDQVNVGIDMGSRVAIVGPNGAGKSTLLNLLAGDLVPSMGQSRRSHKLRIGRYSQHFVDVLQMDENPVQYLMRLYPTVGLKPEGMRAMLGKFGLSGHNHLTPINKLSGGQKARVVFASISLSEPHILLLDEPTNNLDMQSIDALAECLDEFTGGVVLVSHDSRLIRRLCADEERSELWIVDEGTVTKYESDFEDFREELVREIQAEHEEDDKEKKYEGPNGPNGP
eukprot:CAMPEP_0198199776 /NCGR_PEP_ID=MMETSP1445-20131203/2944_1 /TAXON_ID=36898 /ORGANISM="Pyramimonas sp., Strain CCMP2087" /LENGTH=747 /DNA_ID=CAMNT_0043869669 /DNA_START=107 /DNA_END=2350 /DNA_ORIENTATION=+